MPAAAAIDVVGRLASRSLVIVDDDAGRRPFATGCSTASGRSRSTRWPTPGCPTSALARARRMVRRRRRDLHPRVCAAAAKPSTSRSPGPNGPTSTPRWRGAPSHDPLLALRLVNGFGWAWVVLGDSRGAQRILAALDAAGDAGAAPATGPTPCCSRRGSKRRPVASSSPATTSPPPTELADAIDDVDLQARCSYYLAYVVSHDGEFRQALELTDRSRRALRRAGPAVGSGRELALRRPGRDLRR